MTNALITGITGMVGSHLADYLIKNTKWNIYGLVRWRSNLENINHLIEMVNNKKRIFLVYGDLNDSVSLNNVLKQNTFKYIFHLAAQSYPKTSFTSPIDTFNTNAMGTMKLLEAVREYSHQSLVHVCSSSEIFGRVTEDKLPINEECNFHPASPYAISKAAVDLIGRYYYEAYGLKIQTTRMFTHTGPRRGDVFAESTFAKQIAMIEHGLIKPIVKCGNLKSLRTVTDVRDAVEAYYLLLTKNPMPGQYYNIGGSKTLTVGQILDYLINISEYKKKIKIQIDPERIRPIDADLQIPDISKFTNHTGWKPKINFEKTMLDLLNYWRAKVSDNKSNFLIR